MTAFIESFDATRAGIIADQQVRYKYEIVHIYCVFVPPQCLHWCYHGPYSHQITSHLHLFISTTFLTQPLVFNL